MRQVISEEYLISVGFEHIGKGRFVLQRGRKKVASIRVNRRGEVLEHNGVSVTDGNVSMFRAITR